MERVKRRSWFSHEMRIYFAVFVVYFIAAFCFLYFGFKPASDPSTVYAAEAATADTMLTIENANLSVPVSPVERVGDDLIIPEQIVGSYSVHENKTLLMGHSSTAFANLSAVSLNAEIIYGGKTYIVSDIKTLEKSEISMKSLLASADTDTIILMTCAGSHLEGSAQDYTHRLLVTAELK